MFHYDVELLLPALIVHHNTIADELLLASRLISELLLLVDWFVGAYLRKLCVGYKRQSLCEC